ncbi:MAG TPA: hypothetical protein VMF11_08595 [Candidatus Baltobacteraceae bacterium]|nr:hypothetical protein [Candidatus Baltobacteraceae bacterium]
MVATRSEISQRHAQLHEGAACLFRALDEHDGQTVTTAFRRFTDDLEAHLSIDLAVGYRLLLRHPSDSVRRIAERVIDEQEHFPQQFEVFSARWRRADRHMFLTQAFRDELETLVSNLLKRIRIEERLLSALSSVA